MKIKTELSLAQNANGIMQTGSLISFLNPGKKIRGAGFSCKDYKERATDDIDYLQRKPAGIIDYEK